MTKPVEIKVGKLSLADLPRIVDVHVQSFPQSSTTRLGPEAVCRYYQWQFIGPHQAHYLGAWVDGQLRGFCFCGRFRGALGGFVARNQWFLTRQLLLKPWLMAHAEIRSAVSTAIRALLSPGPASPPRNEASQTGRFGILAIAVAPPCRRLGLGARLMEEAEKSACKLGFAAMGLTVNPANEPAIRFYQRLGWKPVGDDGLWRGRMEKSLGKV